MSQQNNVVVQFDNVVFAYPYYDRQVLRGASFTLNSGVNTILCDSAGGKTTICKLICKDIVPTSGTVTLNGRDVNSITNADLGILYLPQVPTFFGARSVLTNVCYPLKVRKVARKSRLATAQSICSRLEIDYTNIKAKSLTASQAQLVALARGLTVDRSLVLLDDWNDSRLIDTVLQQYPSTAVVIVTSNVALARGNTVVIDYGKAVYQGDCEHAQQIVADSGWLCEEIKEK